MKNEQIINGLTELDVANLILKAKDSLDTTKVDIRYVDIYVSFDMIHERGGIKLTEEGRVTLSSNSKGEATVDDWDIHNVNSDDITLQGTPIKDLNKYSTTLRDKGILDSSDVSFITNINEKKDKRDILLRDITRQNKLVHSLAIGNLADSALKAFEYLHGPEIKEALIDALSDEENKYPLAYPIDVRVGTIDKDKEGAFYTNANGTTSHLGELNVIELLEFYNTFKLSTKEIVKAE